MQSQGLSFHPQCSSPSEYYKHIHTCRASGLSSWASLATSSVFQDVSIILSSILIPHCCDKSHRCSSSIRNMLLWHSTLSQLWAFQVPCNGTCGIGKGSCLAKALRKGPKLQELSDHLFCWSEPLKGFGWAENKHRALCQACWRLQPLLPVKDTEILNAM